MQKKIIKNVIIKMVFTILVVLGTSGCAGKSEVSMNGFMPAAENQEIFSETEAVVEETDRYTIAKTGERNNILAKNFRETETEVIIQVFVCGAVEHPGVYKLKERARVYEAVEAAGGFETNADQDWLNLAEMVQDGEQLRVYTLEETQELRAQGLENPGITENTAEVSGMNSKASGDGEKINLNTATREQLMTLPGIGEAKADAVIAYREEMGNFQSIEEIMNISGIKEAVFLKIKDKIAV